ncbi:MAG: MaoC family dehydratase N-terminal domain-containing protein [Clostridia bacterium]|nr:MaoC family dehydratase N-terminal domain-containing protein [Clostridia bacterium]
MAGQFPRITDEALAALRERIGVPITPPQPFVEEATRDTIRHYADGIGDPNPLWRDEQYARKTRWGGILAPPSMLYAFDRVVSGWVGGLPGVHAMFAGTDWHWFLPVRLGDRITARSHLKDVIEKESEFSGRAVQQIYEVSFYNQKGELVARADSWCFRTERSTARERGKYRRLEAYRYTEEELRAIFEAYDREEIRGATPRYWEDVAVGEELTPVVKGPLTATSVIAFDQGWGGLYLRAHRFMVDLLRRHPALGIPNAQNVPEPPERVHWDNDFARAVGVPMAYDYGPERVSWLSHLLTNWIGDDGFLKRLYAEVRRFNLLGDTTWCKGRVTGKRVEGGEHLVDVEVWAEDQRGEVTAKGFAVAALPSRGSA